MPANNHLRRGLAVLLGDAGDRRVVQQPTLAQRAPCLGGDAELGVHVAQLTLGQQRMQLDLVDHRHDPGRVDQGVEVFRLEVRHPDRADPPEVAHRSERPEGVDELADRGHRPVNQVEVEVAAPVVEAEPFGALLARGHRLAVALVGIPELGDEEYLLTRNTGLRDRTAHFLFVAIPGGGVDVPVAGLQRRTDGFFGRLGWGLPHPQANAGNRIAVVEPDRRSGHGHSLPARLESTAWRRRWLPLSSESNYGPSA